MGRRPAKPDRDPSEAALAAPLGRPAARSLPSFPKQLSRLRRELFQANQRTINQAIETTSREFRRYEARYRQSLLRSEGPISRRALHDELAAAAIVLVGDYHTFPPAQWAFEQLVRVEVENGPLVIGLEMMPGAHQEALDRFLAGRMQESTFLKKIAFRSRWPFGSFAGFRSLFDFARERQIPMLALDAAAPGSLVSLAERDRYAAERIAAATERGRVFCLFGDMHLAPPHLPRAITRALGKKRPARLVTIHQTPEPIWFDLEERGLIEQGDVVRIRDHVYALLTDSPLVLQQSYLTWLDQMENSSVSTGFDPEAGERLVEMSARAISSALSLEIDGALEDVEIVGPGDLSFLERLASSGRFKQRELLQIRQHILSSESCYIPQTHMIYLANLSLTHAAEESAHLLRHVLSHEGIDDPKALVDAFYARVIDEAIGFLGSKIVNPRRRSLQISSDDPLSVEVGGWVQQHKQMERGELMGGLPGIFRVRAQVFNGVTRMLGSILGDQLYHALSQGKFSREQAAVLFAEPIEEEGAALTVYFELIARVGRLRPPRRVSSIQGTERRRPRG